MVFFFSPLNQKDFGSINPVNIPMIGFMVKAHFPKLTSSSSLGFCQFYWTWLPAKKDEEMTATKSC